MPPQTDDQFIDSLFTAPAPPADDGEFIDGLFQQPPEQPRFAETEGPEQAMAAVAQDAGAQPPLTAQQGEDLMQATFEHRAHKTVEDAQAYWRSLGHSYALRPEQKVQVEEAANGLAFSALLNMGLASEDRMAAEVSPEMAAELIGTVRGILVPLYAPMSEQEQHGVTRDVMRLYLGRVREQAVVRLNQLRAEQEADPDEIARFQDMAAQAQEFASRAEDPRIQRIWQYHMREGFRRLQAATPADSDAAVQLGLTSSTFSDIEAIERAGREEGDRVRRRIQALGPANFAGEAQVRGESAHTRIERLMGDTFTSLRDVFSSERAMKAAYEGVLQKQRFGRLGLTDVQSSDGLVAAVLAANPGLAGELLTAGSTAAVKREMGVDLETRPTEGQMKKITDRLPRAQTRMLDRLALISSSPLNDFFRAPVFEDAADTNAAVAGAFDRSMGRLMQAYQLGLPVAETIQDVLIQGDLSAVTDRGKYLAGVQGLASSSAQDAARRMGELDAELEQLEEDATGVRNFSRPAAVTKLLGPAGIIRAGDEKPAQLQKFLEHGDKVTTIQYAQRHIVESVLNPEGDLLTSVGIAINQDRAAEIFSQGAARVGFSPRVAQQQFKASVRRAIDSAPFGFTAKELKEADELTARSLRNMSADPSFSEAVKLTGRILRGAVIRTGNDIKETVALFGADPKEGANALILFGGGGVGLAAAAQPLRKRLSKLSQQWFAMRDARKVLRDAAAVDATGTEDLLRMFTQLADGADNQAYRRQLDSVVANLRTLRDGHKLPLEEAAGGGVRMDRVKLQSRTAMDFEKQLRKVDSKTIYNLLEGIGADAETIASLGRFGLRDLVNRIPAALGFGGFKVPSFLARRGRPLFAKIQNAIDAGVDPGQWGELPLSIDAIALGGGEMRLAWHAGLQRLFPKGSPVLLQKVAPRLFPNLDGSIPRELAQFWNNYKSALVSHRALVSERLADIDDFVSTQINARVARLRDEHVRAATEPSAELRQEASLRREEVKADVANLVNQRNDIANTVWDAEVDLARLDWVQRTGLEDVLYWALRRHGEADVYDSLRLVDEDLAGFRNRVTKALAGGGDERSQQIRRSLKNNLIKAYLRSPGLTDEINIDLATGNAVTSFRGARLGARRRALAERESRLLEDEVETLQETVNQPGLEGDKKRLAQRALKRARAAVQRRDKIAELSPRDAELALRDDLGLVKTEDVLPAWIRLKEFAANERQLLSAFKDPTLYRKLSRRVQDLSALPADLQRKELTDFVYNLHLNAYIAENRLKNFSNAVTKLTPEERELLDVALEHRSRFKQFHTLDELRERVPEVFAAYPRTSDEAISRLLRDSQDFQKNFVESLADASGEGARFDPVKKHLLKPYVPSKFLTHEHNAAIKDVMNVPAVETVVSPLGVDMSFTLPQRSLSDFRAIVSLRGGAPILKSFGSRAEAEAWVGKRFGGTRGDRTEGDGFVEGTTALGDNWQVLDPIDPQVARDLGMLPNSKALAARFRDLIQTATTQRMLNFLDRPGWTMTADEFREFAKTKHGRAVANDYRAFPDKAVFGTLAGKRIHKRAFAAFQDFQSYSTILDTAIDALKTQSESLSFWGNLLTKSATAIGKTVQVTKRALVQNQIARNWKVIAANLIGDKFLFGTAAMGRGFVTTPTGWRASQEALRDLWAFIVRGEAPDNPIFREAIEAGVIDDFSLIGRMDNDTRRSMNELFFNTPDTALPDKVRLYGKAIQDWDGDTAFDAFATAVGTRPKLNTQEQGLARRWTEIDEALRDRKDSFTPEQLDALERERLSIENLFEQNRTMWGNVGRASTATWNWLTGAPGGILRDKDVFSSRFYNLANNMGRLSAFYYGRARGMSPDYAGWRVDTFMQTYSKVPRAIRNFSGRNPLANPVVAFPYEAIRVGGNMIRYNWPAFMAFTMGTNAWNFFAMASGGVDPYEAYKDLGQHSPYGAADLFAGTMMLPNFDGTFNTARFDALNYVAFLRYSMDPVYGELLPEGDAEHEDMFGRALTGAATTLGATFFGGPLAKLGVATFRGVDPSNGRPVENWREALGLGLVNLGRTFIPPETPFVGTVHHEVAQNLESPPYMRSDRRVTLAQKVIQSRLGVKLRGRIANGQIADAFTRTVVALTGGTGGRPIPQEEGKAFDYRDFLLAAYHASRDLDRDKQHTGTMAANDEFYQMRYANWLRNIADKQDDPEAFRREAAKIEREAIRSRVEKRAARLGIAETEVDLTQRFVRSERKAVERARRSTNFDHAFQAAGIHQQAHIILEAASVDNVPLDVLQGLIFKSIKSRPGATRNRTNPEALRNALDEVEGWLRDPWREDTVPLIRRYRRQLFRQLQRARRRDRKNIRRDALSREVIRQLQEQGAINEPTTPLR